MDTLTSADLPLGENVPPQTSARPFVREKNGRSELILAVSGAKCGGCLAKIEKNVSALEGIDHVRMNLSTGRLVADWTSDAFNPDRIIETLNGLGYPSKPFDPDLVDASRQKRERGLLLAMAVAGFAAANIMLLSVSVWAGKGEMSDATRTLLHWVSAAIAIPTVAFSGRPFFSSALGALRGGHVNMDVPISLAVMLATGLSIYETIHHGEHSYFDAAVMLLFFLLIGRFLEARLQRQAYKAADDLAAMQAVTVSRRLADGSIETVASGSLDVGDTLIISTGERLPVDADLMSAEASLNTSLVTGEVMPQLEPHGTRIYAGSVNLGAPIEVAVATTTDDSLIGEISRLLDVGEQKRSKYRQIADKAAELYVPIVHTLAAVAFIGWFMISGDVRTALFTAISVLVITCPCALALAAPVVQIVAAGRLFRANAFLKSGDALERIAACDHIIFDKTGTLTELTPHFDDAEESRENLNLAAHLARASRHPLSRAVVQAACPGPVAENVEEHKGLGLSGLIDGKEARLGSWEWVSAENGAAPEDNVSLWFWIEGSAPAPLHLTEDIKKGAKELLQSLDKLGVTYEICSGDHPARVEEVAARLGVQNYTGGIKPVGKAERVDSLSAEGHKVLMIGDGLNDAGALASSHAALAPGGALDAARTASDAVYSGESLENIATVIRVARSAQGRIKENFGLAVIYNLIAVPIALLGFVTPLIAAIAMSGSSIVVTLNALRVASGKTK
ncbi:MAG TPA: heavy metal translocating P-type ATPase [Hyphomonadaceae bacterium]|nr:heavy metal translocating P-type ATPase [Hyphomonadaceae bacterium]